MQRRSAGVPPVDFSQVLIVAASSVNRVVVSRIVERSGLKARSETLDAAEKALGTTFPGVVILDGGADNRECDGLLAAISTLRQVSGRPVPGVILLCTRLAEAERDQHSALIDAVVAKPITPERLQPVMLDLIEQRSGFKRAML